MYRKCGCSLGGVRGSITGLSIVALGGLVGWGD
jgi:hypothetical protein